MAWTSEGVTELGEGQRVQRWTHPSGAYVDDNTHNVPADLAADLTPAQLAETAFVGHHVTGWDEFPTFAEAAEYALRGGKR